MNQLGLFSNSKHPVIKPNRPTLRYYGGGWTRAKWTVSHFPPHDCYLEPCFGAGSILFHKSPSKLETVNDIDGRVINFFEVLRTRPEELVRQIELTPWAEEEFKECLEPAENPMEDARRFFFTCWASVKGGPNPGRSDFRWQKKLTRRSAAVRDVANLDHLNEAARRLKNVQILNRDALEIIQKFLEEDCLIYLDPPYLHRTRTNNRGYRHETTAEWHEEIACLLRQHKGPVVVSGYASELYTLIYEDHGWRRVTKDFVTNSGGRGVECLWLNPMAVSRLNTYLGI